MLPECRIQDNPYQIPKFELKRDDIENFIEEFKGFHEQFQDCFSRQEPRDNFYRYMAGQLSQLERKSIEPIALNVEDAKVRAMQFFVSNVIWDEDKIISKYRSMVEEDLGDPDGTLIFDESGFVKKGRESVGVARQYCGTIGKVENCQVGGTPSSDWEKKAPAVTLSQLKILIRVVLPLRFFDCESLITLVAWIQEKNHRAYPSHGKRKLRDSQIE